jgi:hypothetical protein
VFLIGVSDDEEEGLDFEDGFDQTISKLMGTGVEELDTVSYKITNFAFVFFNFITLSMYTANLASFMTKDVYYRPIADLSELVSRDNGTYGTFRDYTGDRHFFRSNDMLQSMVKDGETANPPDLYETRAQYLDAVLSKGKAFVTNDQILDTIINSNCRQRLYKLDGYFNQEMTAFAMNKSSVAQKFQDVGRRVPRSGRPC